MRHIITISVLMILVSCQIEPQPISYGEIDCDYCRMSIMDERYGAELISSKGKTYFFDALECQINFRKDHPEYEWKYSLATDYTTRALISTDSIYILQSPALPSPMGMNLSAFARQESAKQFSDSESDPIYQYSELLEQWNQMHQP